jgi:hypothetical protein
MSVTGITLKAGVTIRPGVTVSGHQITGSGGGNSFSAVQAAENTGSNAVHIDVSYPWASTVPVGATIVAAGIGTFTVIAVLTPFEQGNSSGNWFFVVDPTNASFPGGIPLTFTW